jgi:hypothetical protein
VYGNGVTSKDHPNFPKETALYSIKVPGKIVGEKYYPKRISALQIICFVFFCLIKDFIFWEPLGRG